MTDLLRLASDAERNLLPTLSGLSENDIDSIWGYVAEYIERQMTSQKGVHVAGLGTFSFSQLKLDLGNKIAVIQRPVFLLAEKLVQTQNLRHKRPLATATHIPVVALNYAAVSQEGPFEREAVEGCVRETLLLLPRALASGGPAHLALQGVGTLSIRNHKVGMKFNRDFVKTLDSTGRLLLALSNAQRPGSSVSLMSACPTPAGPGPTKLPSVVSPQRGAPSGAGDGHRPLPAPDSRDPAGAPGSRDPRPSRPQPPQWSGVHGIRLSGGPETSDYPPQAAKKSSVSFSPPEGVVTEEEPHRDARCAGHNRAGQELCYLCMQRSQRNVPLYLREARRAEEVEQEVLLLLKGQQEEELYLQGEQAQRGQQRAFSEQVAAFNLGASRTLKEQRAQKPQFHGSYLFAKRPLTAALQGARERGHLEELRDQLLSQRSRSRRAQQEKLLLEKVDQAQLAHEVALQRKQQFLQKQQRVDHYRRALDLQVEHGRGPQYTQDQQPISTGIGRWETAATANENRERAQKVSQEQLMAATQKRKEDVSRRRTQQQTEKEMLSLNRKELILDRLRCSEATKDLRASLEDTWRNSTRLKLRREEEENSFRRFGGTLLLDQGDQHRRCHQCKRKPGNHGESNIWRESCYTSGSRLMM